MAFVVSGRLGVVNEITVFLGIAVKEAEVDVVSLMCVVGFCQVHKKIAEARLNEAESKPTFRSHKSVAILKKPNCVQNDSQL